MGLKIYNPLTQKKEVFEPLEPGHVRMYVCGITAYDRCHIGHARSAVVFDAILRHLRHRGLRVTCVRNFTDVDDKIIARARQEGISPDALAEREITHFYEDMDALGVIRADMEPRAMGHVAEIIVLIETLLQKGHAYLAGGDVYFAVRSFATYGELSRRSLEQMRAGARVAVGEGKRDPLDFALWKASKAGEPTWESPWGPGRPGWHVECSAMSMKYLGPCLDIHGGGLDLIFPHHENERAQSEAATGQRFVRFWVHNGFVTVRGEKMSKSLGNFVTIHEFLRGHHAEALRLLLLSTHYRSPLDYSPEALAAAESALGRCYSALSEAIRVADRPVRKRPPLPEEALEAIVLLEGLPAQFDAAMDDDFNTAEALGRLFDGVRALNRLRKLAEQRPSALFAAPLRDGVASLRRVSDVLGILREEPAAFIRKRDLACLESLGLTEADVLSAIDERTLARKERNWALADRIRDDLAARGVLLQDGAGGTTWGVAATAGPGS